jgi:hypothetical protein
MKIFSKHRNDAGCGILVSKDKKYLTPKDVISIM